MSSRRIIQGTTHNLPDVAAFIGILSTLDQSSTPEVRHLFATQRELFVGRAPGRLDVMGGIADYSGSLVLELPIQEATFVGLQRDSERTLKIVSLSEDSMPELTFEMSLSEFKGADGPVNYEEARRYFQRDPGRHWAAYVAGVFLVLSASAAFIFQRARVS